MIHCIYSTLPTFKNLEFHFGLNVLIAQKEQGASNRQTRNRVGKTSLIEIVHFLTGADAGKDSLFRVEPLTNEFFGMEFDLGGEEVSVERCGKQKSKLWVSGSSLLDNRTKITNKEWITVLGEQIFGLDVMQDFSGRTPTFRSLFAYFARRQLSGAFTTPEKHARMQQAGDYQVALMLLLDLDWKIASDWQQVRDREKTLTELKKAAGVGAFGSIIGKVSDLRTQLTVAEAHLNKLKSQVESFQVLPQYRELEAEADQITRDLNKLANDNVIDAAAIRDLETAMQAEAPPSLSDLESIYAEAGVALPGVAIKRYDEVRSFHESVIRNRKDYLSGELSSVKQRMEFREQQKAKLDQRRAEIMGILQSHGALDQFANLQGEMSRLEAEVESLRQRFYAAEQLEGSKNELEIERNRLTLRLRRDFSEQKQRLTEAILAFEETVEDFDLREYVLPVVLTDATEDGGLFGFRF